jgi:hypothetical protein
VQVVALPNQDELCLYGMKQLEMALSRTQVVDAESVEVRGNGARKITTPEEVVKSTLAALR